jgi:hypothetical protein
MTTLPASGVITLGDVNVALGLARTTQISLGQASVRTLFGVATGTIKMSNGYGKSSGYNLTISANTLKYNLRTALIAAGYSGTGAFKVTITINSGVYVWSDTTATAAFDTGVLLGGTITIINNGYIIGMGGNGAIVGANNGGVGGPAMNIRHSVTITNNSYVAGGGGGGGSVSLYAGGGGGAGGGFGGHWTITQPIALGGAPGLAGSIGPGSGAGGGGGRILPGVGGASTFTSTRGVILAGNGGGAGGSGGCYAGTIVQLNGGRGGAGGSANAVGGNGFDSGFRSAGGGAGGGGGWGASGGTAKNNTNTTPMTPGAGGKCVNLNGFTVTWTATGTRYGVIS